MNSEEFLSYYPETYDEYMSWIFSFEFHKLDPETSIRNFRIAEDMEEEEEEEEEQ